MRSTSAGSLSAMAARASQHQQQQQQRRRRRRQQQVSEADERASDKCDSQEARGRIPRRQMQQPGDRVRIPERMSPSGYRLDNPTRCQPAARIPNSIEANCSIEPGVFRADSGAGSGATKQMPDRSLATKLAQSCTCPPGALSMRRDIPRDVRPFEVESWIIFGGQTILSAARADQAAT